MGCCTILAVLLACRMRSSVACRSASSPARGWKMLAATAVLTLLAVLTHNLLVVLFPLSAMAVLVSTYAPDTTAIASDVITDKIREFLQNTANA